MGNIALRLLLSVLAGIGVYKTFPQVSEPVNYYLQNPKFQTGFVRPAIGMANSFLPSKMQIPTPALVLGDSATNNVSPIQSLTEEVSKKAASLAGEQVEQMKQTATSAFCQVLIERVKSECGLSVSE